VWLFGKYREIVGRVVWVTCEPVLPLMAARIIFRSNPEHGFGHDAVVGIRIAIRQEVVL